MSVHRCLHQRRVHLVGLMLLIGSRLQKKSDHVEMTFVACKRERTLLKFIRMCVDTGTVIEKDL